ncbi:TPA: hypothetical protein ACH3X1_006128 [Trebouxia sp. C0004]
MHVHQHRALLARYRHLCISALCANCITEQPARRSTLVNLDSFQAAPYTEAFWRDFTQARKCAVFLVGEDNTKLRDAIVVTTLSPSTSFCLQPSYHLPAVPLQPRLLCLLIPPHLQIIKMNRVNVAIFFAALLVIGACAEPRKMLADTEDSKLAEAEQHQRILAELEEVSALRERMLQEGEMSAHRCLSLRLASEC